MVTAFNLLGSTTLGSANANITISGLTARKYLIIEGYITKTGSLQTLLRFNNDSGSNYATRDNTNNNIGGDNTNVSQTRCIIDPSASGTPIFFRITILNVSSSEKLIICNTIQQNVAGSANAPTMIKIVEKWTNTSNQITEVDIVASTSTFATGTVCVYGSD